MRIKLAYNFSYKPFYQPKHILFGISCPSFIEWLGLSLVWNEQVKTGE